MSAPASDSLRSRSLLLPRGTPFALELEPTAPRPCPALPTCPTRRPSALREAIVRWLEQEL